MRFFTGFDFDELARLDFFIWAVSSYLNSSIEALIIA
jgi:hypothetical protein